MLEQTGWWEVVNTLSSSITEVMRLSASNDKQLFSQYCDIPQEVGEERFIKCYDEVCAWLLAYVPSKITVSPKVIEDFKKQSGKIFEYLRRAVVPSTIVMGNDTVKPTPIVLINSAFCFYLDHMPELMANIEGRDDSVENRSQFTERLELWVLKALEDSRLLEREEINGRCRKIRNVRTAWS